MVTNSSGLSTFGLTTDDYEIEMSISLFITLRGKLSGAVYCYRSCLCVCVFATGGRAACVCVFMGLLSR